MHLGVNSIQTETIHVYFRSSSAIKNAWWWLCWTVQHKNIGICFPGQWDQLCDPTLISSGAKTAANMRSTANILNIFLQKIFQILLKDEWNGA